MNETVTDITPTNNDKAPEPPTRPLPVHVTELSNEVMAELSREGYTVLPNVQGWMLFVKKELLHGPDGTSGTTDPG